MSRITAILVLGLMAIALAGQNAPAPPRSRFDQNHTQWISGALRSMQTIKPGMTRADLLKVFTEEGGLSTAAQRTYVYQECPYIKVDVKFDAPMHQELPTDKIVEISRPYLEWSIMD